MILPRQILQLLQQVLANFRSELEVILPGFDFFFPLGELVLDQSKLFL